MLYLLNQLSFSKNFFTFFSITYWLKQISLATRPIRNTTQIWVVPSHQYGISALISQTLFRGETTGGVANCRLFSQDTRTAKEYLSMTVQ